MDRHLDGVNVPTDESAQRNSYQSTTFSTPSGSGSAYGGAGVGAPVAPAGGAGVAVPVAPHIAGIPTRRWDMRDASEHPVGLLPVLHEAAGAGGNESWRLQRTVSHHGHPSAAAGGAGVRAFSVAPIVGAGGMTHRDMTCDSCDQNICDCICITSMDTHCRYCDSCGRARPFCTCPYPPASSAAAAVGDVSHTDTALPVAAAAPGGLLSTAIGVREPGDHRVVEADVEVLPGINRSMTCLNVIVDYLPGGRPSLPLHADALIDNRLPGLESVDEHNGDHVLMVVNQKLQQLMKDLEDALRQHAANPLPSGSARAYTSGGGCYANPVLMERHDHWQRKVWELTDLAMMWLTRVPQLIEEVKWHKLRAELRAIGQNPDIAPRPQHLPDEPIDLECPEGTPGFYEILIRHPVFGYPFYRPSMTQLVVGLSSLGHRNGSFRLWFQKHDMRYYLYRSLDGKVWCIGFKNGRYHYLELLTPVE